MLAWVMNLGFAGTGGNDTPVTAARQSTLLLLGTGTCWQPFAIIGAALLIALIQ